MAALKISYKIYLEAEDVSQSRIQSCTSFVDEIVKNHANPYIARAEVTNENDMDDFIVRLYADEGITEDVCDSENDAKAFVDDMVDLLFDIAHMHSFLDMEAVFPWSWMESGRIRSVRRAVTHSVISRKKIRKIALPFSSNVYIIKECRYSSSVESFPSWRDGFDSRYLLIRPLG